MSSQTTRLHDLLSDGEAHRTDEVVRKIYSGGALARVGARIFDVQKKYGVKIIGWHDHDNPKLYWYQIQPIEHQSPIVQEAKFEEMPEFRQYQIINKAGVQAALL